jgi:hypothetical protein
MGQVHMNIAFCWTLRLCSGLDMLLANVLPLVRQYSLTRSSHHTRFTLRDIIPTPSSVFSSI